MASSIPHKSLLLVCALAWLSSASAALPRSESIVVDSDSAELDARTNQIVLPAVRISQGAFTVKANEGRASGLNFENSRWTFKGEVEITSPDGNSKADNAVVVFTDNRVAAVDITGSPATFSQRDPEQGQIAHGRAGAIHYDLSENTVRLSDNAWISYGQNELSADTMVYDLAQKSVVAGNSKQGERVHITINPADAKNKPTTPNREPAP